MPKRTLLNMVQGILASMESDEVNAITDTPEALEVARAIENTYYDLISNSKVPEHNELFELEGLSNVNYPTIMKIPDTISRVEWIRWDSRVDATDNDINFQRLTFMFPDQFVQRTNGLDSTASTTFTINDATITKGVTLLVSNDQQPTLYTSFDDEHIVFNSHLKVVDTTMADSKTQCWGTREPTFSLLDTFIPDIDIDMFPLLYNTAKVVCFADFKQAPNQLASVFARRQAVKGQNNNHKLRVANEQHRPHYGRRAMRRPVRLGAR